MGSNPSADATTTLDAQSLAASLTVRDLQTSLAWYRDVVGFTVDREFARDDRLFAVSLRAGQARVLLTQDDGAKGLDRERGVGFSLQLTTSQSVDAIAARITAHGGTLAAGPTDTRWGARMIRLEDPDGFKFVISSGQPS